METTPHRTAHEAKVPRRARRARLLIVALGVTAAGVTACGDSLIVQLEGYSMERVSPEYQLGIVGNPVASPPTVVIRDRLRIGVPNVPIAFFVSAGEGSEVAPDSVFTDHDGVARVGWWTLGPYPGDYEVVAQVSADGRSAELAFSATAGSSVATTLGAGSPTSQMAVAGQPVGLPPVVFVRDALGLGVPGVTVRFTAAAGSGTVTPTQAVTDGTGRAAVTSWTIGPVVGATNTVTATVPDGGLAGTPVTFTAQGTGEELPPGDPTFLWTSDWGTATGNGLAAIGDNGRWPDRLCVAGSGALIRVVNTHGTIEGLPADWPTNILQVDHNGTNCDAVQAQNLWPAPAVGDTIWFRVLAWLDKCGLNTGPVHNVQSNTGAIAWTITEDQCMGGAVPVGFKSYLYGGGIQWEPGFAIPDSVPLRYEWGLIRESTSRFDALVRVYDDRTGTLLFNETNLRQYNGQSLAAFNATSGFNYSGVGPDVAFRSWILGQQGPGLAVGQKTGAYYYAGAAVCNPGPCGRYTPGEGN